MSEMGELMEKLQREAKRGGELMDLPCPLCGKPRSQRSDYVRCTPCATNWLVGEDLNKDPRIERYKKMRSPNGAQLAPASTTTKIASPASEQMAVADSEQ